MNHHSCGRTRTPGATRTFAWAFGALLSLAVLCCRTAAQNVAAPSPSLKGRAIYEAVLEPGATIARMVSQREYIPAAPAGDNQPPVYPEEIVGLGLPPQKIVLRLFLDETGRIDDIRPSDIPSEVDEKYRDSFQSSIRRAVQTWRFSPAMRRVFVDSPDDGSGQPPYRVLKSETPSRTYFDIRFTFEVHEGKGIVIEGR